MKPETAVSIALMALYKQSGQAMIGFRKDLVNVLVSLRKAGVNTSGLGFKNTPEGLESEEVARFIGRLTMGGYLVQESPIRLTPYGLDLLSSEINEHIDEPSVQKSLEVLGLTLEDLVPTANSAMA